MKKIISTLLAMCMILSTFTIVSAATNWTKASDWAVADLNEAYDMGLFPECLKKRDLTHKITRAEQAALSVKIYEVATGISAVAAQNPFTDTTDEEVLKALSLGVTSGTSATTFEPDANLTREQAATMLSRVYKKINIAGWTLDKDSEFKFEFDMPENFKDHSTISSWAEQSVYFMASKQWILGNEKKEFMPLDNCTREQALIIAKRMATFLKEQKPAEPEKDEYKVAFIGGSLTQGGTRWINLTKAYLQEKMPDKKVVTLNAGIGGTTSTYGATRIQNNVLSKNPDLVVIEFTVNDIVNYKTQAPYVESMLRQCMNSEKVPGVIILHAPYPFEEDSDKYSMWKYNHDEKEKLATHYGIETVNVDEYMRDLYYDSDGDAEFMDWLATYYNKSGSGYDVHPKTKGYELYAEALIQAFDKKGLDKFIKPIVQKPVYTKSDEAKLASAKYDMLYLSNEKFELSPEWTVVTKDKPDTNTQYPILSNAVNYPNSEAAATTMAKGATITFKTTADALYLPTYSHVDGNSVKITVNGSEVGEASSVHGTYNNEFPISKRIDLGGMGEKTVKITTVEDGKPFRLLAIVEEYDN